MINIERTRIIVNNNFYQQIIITNKKNHIDIPDLLRKVGLKSTQQRIMILREVLFSKSHPTVDQIYDTIKETEISVATVYKTLETFEQKGLIHKVMSSDGYIRYDGNTASHNHIYCSNTGEIMDYEDKELEILIKNHFKSKNIQNLTIQDISVQIRGQKENTDQQVIIQ